MEMDDMISTFYQDSVYRTQYYSDISDSSLTDTVHFGRRARLLSLYRGVLSRDPDSLGFVYYLKQLARGNLTWSQVIQDFLNGLEYPPLKVSILNLASCGKPFYGWKSTPVFRPNQRISTQYRRFNGTRLQLQSALYDKANNMDTVTLAPMAVILIDATLTIPKDVTLMTDGAPNTNSYAKMARLIKSGTLNANMIELMNGGKIQNVWIDGRASVIGKEQAYVSVEEKDDSSYGSIKITNCRFSDPSGWTNIHILGQHDGSHCTNAEISNNLITGYANDHVRYTADGISVSCENTLIFGNQLVDVTDVGIVIFRGNPPQHSSAWGNFLLASGNSCTGFLSIDPDSVNGQPANFSGTKMNHNTFWTSAGAHVDMALIAGNRYASTHPWTGLYGSLDSNTTDVDSINTNTIALVDGQKHVSITGNTINVRKLESYDSFPARLWLKNKDTAWASVVAPGVSWSSYRADPFLNSSGHASGVYLSGPNNFNFDKHSDSLTFVATEFDDTLHLSHHHWTWHYGINDPHPPGQDPGSWTLTIPVNKQFRDTIWVQLDEKIDTLRWLNKFIEYENIPPQKIALSQTAIGKAPTIFSLDNNYPNPFNPSTRLRFGLPTAGNVSLIVYDILGREVTTLVSGALDAGYHMATWNASTVASGLYFARLTVTNEFGKVAFNKVTKLLLIK